jgi:hypothetical protein
MNIRISVPVLILLCFLVPFYLIGQEPKKVDEKKPELLTLQVLVVDPDGHPIENAEVSPSGLRTKVEPGSHWGWSEPLHGPIPKLRSNAEGLVALPYPKYVTEEIEVGKVTISVEHPDFVSFREDRSIEDKPAKIELKIGFRIAATAVDSETGEPIKQDLYGLVSGDSRLSDWKLAENGNLVSPVFEPNKTWFRLIKVTPGEPNLYSELIEIDPTDRSRVLLRDVKLSKGTRVAGRLDDSVTRPISNGHVAATIVRRGSDGQEFNWNSKWMWYDKAPIAEDGSFVFESLPTDEVLQLIPICDDWVPTNPTKEEVLPFFPDAAERLGGASSQPQIIRLNGPLVEPILKMTPATSVRVTVVDQLGKPLAGVEVASWPNQSWFDGGSQILGSAYSLSDGLLRSRKQGEHQFIRENRYTAKTDEHGIAVIRSLPTDRTEGLVAYLKGYEMPLNGTSREIRIDLKPGVVTEVTIKMQPEGTDVLKDEAFQGGVDD